MITPIGTPSRSNGVASTVRTPVDCCMILAPEIRFRSLARVVNVNRLPVDNGSASGQSTVIGVDLADSRIGSGP